MAAAQHDLGLRPRSSFELLLRVPSNLGSSTVSSQSPGSSSASFDFSLKNSLSSAPTSALQSEPATDKVSTFTQAFQSPLVSSIATPPKAESVGSWLLSSNETSSRTVVQSEGSAQSVPDIDIEDVPSMASVAVVELERPIPAADLEVLMSIGLGSIQPVLEVSEDKKRVSPLASSPGPVLNTPSTPKCLAATGSGCGVDLEASTSAATLPQENVMGETGVTGLKLLPPASGKGASAGIPLQRLSSSTHGIFHRMVATLFLALVAFLAAKRICACDTRHMLKLLSSHTSFSFIPAVVDAARSCSTTSMVVYLLLAVLLVYVIQEVLSCPERRFLPILIEGKEIEVKVDSAGCNTMPNRVARELGLKIYEAPLVLLTPFTVRFYSRSAVDVEVSLLGCSAKETITFRIMSDVAPYPTVNRAFRDRHGLESPRHERFIYRACNMAEVIDYLGITVSGSVSHSDDAFEWLDVQLTLVFGVLVRVAALIDTGSDFDAISLSFATKNFPRGRYQKCNRYIKCTGNGHRVHVTKMIVTTILINGKEIERSFLILPGLQVDMILGDPFYIEYDPLTTMADQTFLKPLTIARAISASQYHCGMVSASTGTSWLMKLSRKVRKQPAAPPSAQLELALRRAEHEEYTLQVNAAKRANALGAGAARTEALRLEDIRHTSAMQNLEGMDRALRNAQAQEDGYHIAPLPADAAPALAPGTPTHAPALAPGTPTHAPAPVLPIQAPAPTQAIEPAAAASTSANATLDLLPLAGDTQSPSFAHPTMPAPAKAEPTGADAANREDPGVREIVPANAEPDGLPPPTMYQAEDCIKDGTATQAMFHNTEMPADTANSDDSMYGGQKSLNTASMTISATGYAQTLVGSMSNARNDSHATGGHDIVTMPPTGDPSTDSSNPETEGSSETRPDSYCTGSSESRQLKTSTGHTNGHARDPLIKADTTATDDPTED